MQVSGKISSQALIKFYSTFKPWDQQYEFEDIEDEPISLKNEWYLKHVNKLPTYRFQIIDNDAFQICLKLLYSVLKNQSHSESNIDYFSEFLKLFFKLEIHHKHDICFHDLSDSDRDILIGILAPQILNKNNPDEDERDQQHVSKEKSLTPDGANQSASRFERYKDCLSFADIENQSFLELVDLDCFTWINSSAHKKDESFMNTESNDGRAYEEIIENEPFIPYFKQDYSVLFGTSNYFAFIRWLFTMYERMKYVIKLVREQVNLDYDNKREEVMYYYNNYLRAKERIKEAHKFTPKHAHTNSNINMLNEETDIDENNVKNGVVNHKLSILIGLTISRFKSKIDSATHEDLVRTFLGIKSFPMFMYDKLIHTTIKAFHTLLQEEYLKSRSFRLFQKYSSLHDRQRERLYLEDYRQNLNDMNVSGNFAARLLYSPLSKILCINFFDIHHPFTNTALVDQLKDYKSNYTSKISRETFYSGDLKLPSSNVFLMRNIKEVVKSSQKSLELSQNLSNSFANNSLQIRYRAGETDIIHRKRRRIHEK